MSNKKHEPTDGVSIHNDGSSPHNEKLGDGKNAPSMGTTHPAEARKGTDISDADIKGVPANL